MPHDALESSFGTYPTPGTSARESAPLPDDDWEGHPFAVPMTAEQSPMGQVLSAAVARETARRRNDATESAARERLWEALVARVTAGRTARLERTGVACAGLLFDLARVFLRHAIRPCCDACGADIETPMDGERIVYANAPNRVRFDGLVCAPKFTGPDFTGHYVGRPCVEAMRQRRRAESKGGVVTLCGPIRARDWPDLVGTIATPDGTLLVPATDAGEVAA